MTIFRTIWSFHFFHGVCQLCWVNFLQQEPNCLQSEADHWEAEGLQQVEFAVARSEAEGLYGLL